MMLLLLLLLLVLALSSRVQGLQPSSQTKIQVCQNKDCKARFQGKAANLVQTLENLVSDTTQVEIEATGCLSQCGLGPNLCLHQKNEEILLHGVDTAAAAAAELELKCDIVTHPTLLAAVNVMEKAKNAKDKDEKLRFLNSVINKLNGNEELKGSTCHAFALCQRAQVHLDHGQYGLAIVDAQTAAAMEHAPTNTYRIMADANEGRGDYRLAIQAWQRFSYSNPQFQTKASKEIQRLKSQWKDAANASDDWMKR